MSFTLFSCSYLVRMSLNYTSSCPYSPYSYLSLLVFVFIWSYRYSIFLWISSFFSLNYTSFCSSVDSLLFWSVLMGIGGGFSVIVSCPCLRWSAILSMELWVILLTISSWSLSLSRLSRYRCIFYLLRLLTICTCLRYFAYSELSIKCIYWACSSYLERYLF